MSNTNSPKQSVLEKLRKKSISAKDISGQFWCEKQMEFSYIYGFPKTKAMDGGSAIHQQMQEEVYRPLMVEPATWPDRMYKTAYENLLTLNTLLDKKVARELKIYGSINGYLIVGQIDELRFDGEKVVIVENKTTTSSGKMSPQYMRPHIVQIMLYKKLFDDIKSGVYGFANLDVHYKLSQSALSTGFMQGLKEIGVNGDLMSLKSIYAKMFAAMSGMPALSNSLTLHYVDRSTKNVISDITVDYDWESLHKDLIYALKYWNGERDASPVPHEEIWKCNICRFFGKECKVWWTG
ncbi:MAG: exonuclease V [Candidatus Marsarchaeota archaeon]|nr:exonuclease V [Candidatus Marsarchaeota archaeon]